MSSYEEQDGTMNTGFPTNSDNIKEVCEKTRYDAMKTGVPTNNDTMIKSVILTFQRQE